MSYICLHLLQKGLSVMSEIKFECFKRKKRVISVRSTSRESEQRIPLW